MAEAPPPLTIPRLLVRGLRIKCPLCGAGVRRAPLAVHERCPRCNFPVEERVEGHMVGFVAINTTVTFGLVAIVMVVTFAVTYPDLPVVPLLGVLLVVAVGFPLWFLTRSHTVWSAIDLAMTPVHPDDDVDPEWLPSAAARK
jgi:uncharacterized protein (DUF983 family)